MHRIRSALVLTLVLQFSFAGGPGLAAAGEPGAESDSSASFEVSALAAEYSGELGFLVELGVAEPLSLATADFDEQKALFRQILERWMEDPWTIAICTPPPQPVIVKNSMRNVPEVAISEWNLLTPGATATEQYFFKR